MRLRLCFFQDLQKEHIFQMQTGPPDTFSVSDIYNTFACLFCIDISYIARTTHA